MEQQILDSDLTKTSDGTFDWRTRDASKGKRFLNLLIDIGIFYTLTFVIGFLIVILGSVSAAQLLLADGFSQFITFLIYISYYVVTEATLGKTIGKAVTKTSVVNEQGERPTVLNILGRTLCRFIPFDALSFLFSGTGWHDNISKTYVVNDEK